MNLYREVVPLGAEVVPPVESAARSNFFVIMKKLSKQRCFLKNNYDLSERQRISYIDFGS
jgi:hypothetical protein